MTSMRNWDDMVDARAQAVIMHADWKQRSHVSDLLLQHKWSTLWSDLTGRTDPPLVEDLYTEALEDKSYTAAGLHPQIIVAPSLATRADRGETIAAKKRKVFSTYALNSRFPINRVRHYMDWFKEGASYAIPHSDQLWNRQSKERHPFFIRIPTKQVFPMAHDSRGRLTAGLVARVRRVIDIENEWHVSLEDLIRNSGNPVKDGGYSPVDTIEEIMWFDEERWAWAIYDQGYADWTGNFRYMASNHLTVDAGRAKATGAFILPPTAHKMGRCPMIEMKRATGDDNYRGALDVMIPQLKTAHNVMARILKDIDMNIFAPKVFRGIINPADWGPDAELLTDGTANAGVDIVREPINFEANQIVAGQLDAARGSGKYPQQRSGEPGASINSAKGSHAVMGGFNSEQAAAQSDLAQFLEDTLSVTAEFDEKWCGGSKNIMGFDQGQAYDERYDPRSLFNSMKAHEAGEPGDYRVLVTFGGGLGLDAASYLIQLGTAMQLKGMSRRTYMMKAGLIDDVVSEENEMLLESIADAYQAFMGQQALQSGNLDPLMKIIEKLDMQKGTARQAIIEATQETFAVPAGPGGGPGSPPGGGPIDTIQQARSMASGGMPSAEGQPGPGIRPELAGVLPSRVRRALSEQAPGGTAA